MGVVIFNKSGVFYPSQYHLIAGDTLELVLVGGGAAGASRNSTVVSRATDTFFGSHFRAKGGHLRDEQGGAHGGMSVSGANAHSGGGGGGGFFPGQPIQGGSGCYIAVPEKNQVAVPAMTSGGSARGYTLAETTNYYPTVVGQESGNNGGGNGFAQGARENMSPGSGGAGYGAGGGGLGSKSGTAFHGGAGGEIIYETYVLTQEDVDNGIPITVGWGGLGHFKNMIEVKAMPKNGTSILSLYKYNPDKWLRDREFIDPDWYGMVWGSTYDSGGNYVVNGKRYLPMFNFEYFRDPNHGVIIPMYTQDNRNPMSGIRLYGFFFATQNKFYRIERFKIDGMSVSVSLYDYRAFVSNGYVVLFPPNSSYIYYCAVEDIISGAPKFTKGGGITSYAKGVVGNDFVIGKGSGKEYYVCKDWTPEKLLDEDSFTKITVTTNTVQNITNLTTQYALILEWGDRNTNTKSFVVVKHNDRRNCIYYNNDSSHFYYISDMEGGVLELMQNKYSYPNAYSFGRDCCIVDHDWEHPTSSGGTGQPAFITDITKPPYAWRVWSIYLPVDVEIGSTDIAMRRFFGFSNGADTDFRYGVMLNLEEYQLSTFVSGLIGKYGLEVEAYNTLWGYAGVPGKSSGISTEEAGGAGGCCLISW